MEFSFVSLLVNGLLAAVLFFMKQSNDMQQKDITTLKDQMDRVRDTYFKKEDFREFREELWVRLETLRMDFKQDIERINHK